MKDVINDLRLPPQNIEAEEAILGGILLDPGAIERVVDILEPDAFYLSAHKTLYKGLLWLHQNQKPTDLLAICDWLMTRDKLLEIGGRNKLATLISQTISAANIDKQAELVMAKYQRRQILSSLRQSLEFAVNESNSNEEVIEYLEKTIFAATQANQKSGFVQIGEAALANYEALATKNSPNPETASVGVKTGFYDFDAMTSGLQRSDLVIIGGRPGQGKTAFAMNCAENIALNSLPVVVFSLEMSCGQLTQRVQSKNAEIPSEVFRAGNLSSTEWEKLALVTGVLGDLPIFIDEDTSVTVAQMLSRCRKLQSQHGQLGCVITDYLQLMESRTEGNNRTHELSAITRSLKKMARELKTPVIALSQLSRNCESRQDKRPLLSDLRDSGGIEQDADIVAFLYRDEYYNKESTDKGIAELIIAKHRNGPTGTIKLFFESQLVAFRNLRQGR